MTEKIRLKFREDFQSTPIEVTTPSSDVAAEEQVFFIQAHNENESDEQTTEREEQSRQNAKYWVPKEEPPSLKTSVKQIANNDGHTASYSMNGITINAQVRVRQDVDLVSKKPTLKTLGQPHDEVRIITGPPYKHYKAKKDRNILKDSLVFRNRFGETGSAKYYRILIPKQLVKAVLRSLRGEFGKHPGITKTLTAYREKNYDPKMAQFIRSGSC